MPWPQLKGRKNKLFYYAALVSFPALKAVMFVFPKLANNFAAVVLKPALPADIHPWLLWEEGSIRINKSWLARRYGQRNVDT